MFRSQLGNRELRWETSEQANVGLDMAEVSMAEIMELASNLVEFFFLLPII